MNYTVNPRVEEIEPSVIRALNARKKASSIDLGLGEPTLAPKIAYLEAATRWVESNACRYTPNAGEGELRAAIAAHYAYPSLDAADNVVITAGSQEAVYLSIKALLDPAKDALLVVEPAFPVYGKCAQMEGIAVERVALVEKDDFAFDAERILAAVTSRTRMIVVCSPCNPSARVITREQMAKVAEGLLARGGMPVYVLHDEVYREQTFVDDAGWFGTLYPHTVIVNSLSKSNALTGMRLGWVIAPKAVVPAMIKAHAWIVSTANTYAQRVALEIFRAPGGLREQFDWYRERRTSTIQSLAQTNLRHLPIDGSFYVAVKLADGAESLAFAHRLVEEEDVVAIPGSTFGASFEGWLRCSWVAPEARVRDGFARIVRAGASAAIRAASR